MNMQEIRAIAKVRGVANGRLNKIGLVQALQTAEGNEPCYGTGKSAVCGEHECLWKDDCK
jgi:hypothetical protein